MKQLDTNLISKWVQGTAYGHAHVNGVKVDNREIKTDDLFVCLKGARVDGHDFATQAIAMGATALIVDHVLDVDICQIVVEDTMEALRDLGNAYRNELDAYFIGITGSNGKTSSKDMLYSILKRVGPTVATFRNQNTEIGSFLNIFRMDDTTKYGVMEMGLDYPGEISVMTHIVKPDAAIVTSLAPTHIVNFRDINHIAEEKFSIFDCVDDNNRKYYQGDFAEYRTLDHGYQSFGFNANNDYVVSDVVSDTKGVMFKVNGIEYRTNLLGEHQASNAAGVIALCHDLGIPEDAITEGLDSVELTSLRMELVDKKRSLVLLDAYKSNPISAKFALQTLEAYAFRGNKYAVLSGMVELGDDSIQLHKEVLEYVSSLNLNHTYIYGKEFEVANAEALIDHDAITFVESYEKLYEITQNLFQEECMILIKGSRFYALETLMEGD